MATGEGVGAVARAPRSGSVLQLFDGHAMLTGPTALEARASRGHAASRGTDLAEVPVVLTAVDGHLTQRDASI